MGWEAILVNGLVGLVCALASWAITHVTPMMKGFISSRMDANKAQILNHVMDGLSTIAMNVVGNFNQLIVNDAKKNGMFDANLAASVKKDAMDAVKSQGASLIALSGEALGDVESFLSHAIEGAVVAQKK